MLKSAQRPSRQAKIEAPLTKDSAPQIGRKFTSERAVRRGVVLRCFRSCAKLKKRQKQKFSRRFAPDPSFPSPPLSNFLPQLLVSNASHNTTTHGRVAADWEPNLTQATVQSNLINARPASMMLKKSHKNIKIKAQKKIPCALFCSF